MSEGLSNKIKGRAYVGVQILLVAIYLFIPQSDDWQIEGPAQIVTFGLIFGGAGLILLSVINLGTSLSASPEPSRHGELVVKGLYRLVRHPIYLGLLVALLGLAIGKQSYFALAFYVVFSIFLHVKASWEETRLTATYPEYAEYAKRTPRLIPFLNLITNRF